MRSDGDERDDTEASRSEEDLEELYEQPLAVRQRRDGLRNLGKRYRRWD